MICAYASSTEGDILKTKGFGHLLQEVKEVGMHVSGKDSY